MSTSVRGVGQRGKRGESELIVLRVMNRWMDEDREVQFTLRGMADEIGYSSTTVNNAVKNLRLSRKITRVFTGKGGHGDYPTVYRVNPSGVLAVKCGKKLSSSGAK